MCTSLMVSGARSSLQGMWGFEKRSDLEALRVALGWWAQVLLDHECLTPFSDS